LTNQDGNVTVQVRYKEVEKTFSGNPEEIWLLLNRFFSQFLPTFNIAGKLVLNVDLKKLADDCENLIAFAEEGAHLLVPRNKLTDNETLSLALLANYLGHQLGEVESSDVSKEELQNKLGKDGKITSNRLGELVKSEMATKTQDEKYRITTFGVTRIQKDMLPKLRARIGN